MKSTAAKPQRVVLVYRGRYQVREALDLETLAVILRNAGHSVTLVHDPDVFGLTDNVLQIGPLARLLSCRDKVMRRIADADPDVVLFSVLPTTYPWCREAARTVREQTGARIVFFGLHPSLAAEHCSRDEEVDYVIEGETENVVLPLLDVIAGEGDPSSVGNLWYRDGGEPRFTQRAPLVDMDALPLPDKGLFKPRVSHAYSYVAMVSRGCPYRCTFCEETCSKKLYGASYYRRKSVDTVMRELNAGRQRYRFREVIFKDSYLSGNKAWLRELMARYKAEIGVPFKCFCTVHGFDEETALLLKEAGCYNIEFGLQTWNEQLRTESLDRLETNAEAVRTFGHCARHGLWYDVDHMFNLPGETEADHILSAGYYARLKYLNRIKVHFLVYLPKADIVDDALALGIVPADIRERLAEGWESDFYDQAMAGEEDARLVSGYASLYKLLPALPSGLVKWFLKRQRVRLISRVPKALMAALQALMALRSGDLRFAAYLQSYPRKVLCAVRDRLFD